MSWTELLPPYLRIVLVLAVTSSSQYTLAWDTRLFRPLTPRYTQLLLRSLNISRLPDVPKMNVSQEEYETKFQEYQTRLKESTSDEHLTFHSLKHSDESRRLSIDFTWAKNLTKDISISLGSKIRVFVDGNYNAEFEIRRTGRLIESRKLQYLPRWIDVDGGTEWWNYRLDCKNCYLSRAVVVVQGRKEGYRNRRNSERTSHTDCRNHLHSDGPRRKCCRHQMQVVFSELKGYEFILQPYNFDAGYCKGGCPYRHNHASNHASLLMLMRRLKKGDSPKPCCAPIKLEPLQILHVDENDSTKLKVSTLDEMKVTECACS